MVRDMAENVDEFTTRLGGRMPSAIASIARLPGSNTWRVPTPSRLIERDVITRGHSTQETADRLHAAGYTLFGWDLEWEMTGRGGTGRRQTVAEMIAQIEQACHGALPTAKPHRVILLSHDRQFRASTGGRLDLDRLVSALKARRYRFDTLNAY